MPPPLNLFLVAFQALWFYVFRYLFVKTALAILLKKKVSSFLFHELFCIDPLIIRYYYFAIAE